MKRFGFAGLTMALAFCGLADADFEITTNDTVVTVRCLSDNQPTLTVPFFKEDVSKVIFDANKFFLYNPTEPSTYEGGTEILKGQVYPLREDAFGTGPVIVGSREDASLMVKDVNLTIPNKIVMPRSNAYAVGFGNDQGSLTVKSLGTGGSQINTVRFGRVSKGSVGRVTLSLTEPDSEEISAYMLMGALQLTLDGGTIKARWDAANPFFKMSTADDPDISVTTRGVTFENPAGSTLVLGQPLKFPGTEVVTVIDTYLPTNPGFESGSTGWHFTQNPSDSGSEVKTTPNDWDNSGANPPDGAKFAMLREGASVSTDVNLPSEGFWRVVFKRGGRNLYSVNVPVLVKIDGETIYTVPKTNALDFFECTSPYVKLPEGSHYLEIAAGSGAVSHSVNIDSVRFERVSVETVCGTLCKAGAGTLAFDGDDFTHVPMAVSEGTLSLKNMTLTDNAITVADGSTLSLAGISVAEGSSIAVAAGGRLTVSELDDNLVVNGDFEADGAKTYASCMAPKNWQFSRDEVLTSNGDWGLLGNPDPTLTSAGPLSPNGKCAIYLRESQSTYQSVNVAVAGTYLISFLSADRKYADSQNVPFSLVVDGETKLTQGARPVASDFVMYSVDVELTAGAHEIRLRTGKANNHLGKMVLFDNVSLRQVLERGIAVNGELNMAAGSTLDISLCNDLTVKDFSVDGVKINGRRSAIERAGVTVIGEGNIRVGDPTGLILILR